MRIAAALTLLVATNFESGYCLGVVKTLMTLGGLLHEKVQSCSPGSARGDQGVRVVLLYMQQHPELLHQSFLILATDALRQAWPCRE